MNLNMDRLIDIVSTANQILASGKPAITFNWQNSLLEEVHYNALKSLATLYPACETYKASKIAAAHAYWIVRLKPCFNLTKISIALNEYVAVYTAFAIVLNRLDVKIKLNTKQLIFICETLRYQEIPLQTIKLILDFYLLNTKN